MDPLRADLFKTFLRFTEYKRRSKTNLHERHVLPFPRWISRNTICTLTTRFIYIFIGRAKVGEKPRQGHSRDDIVSSSFLRSLRDFHLNVFRHASPFVLFRDADFFTDEGSKNRVNISSGCLYSKLVKKIFLIFLIKIPDKINILRMLQCNFLK